MFISIQKNCEGLCFYRTEHQAQNEVEGLRAREEKGKQNCEAEREQKERERDARTSQKREGRQNGRERRGGDLEGSSFRKKKMWVETGVFGQQ